MNKYKTANGTIATEQELRSYYGARFEEMLASGAFVKVEDGTELKKKVSPVLPMAPQQEQVPNAIPGVQPYTGSPSEDTSLDSQSSTSNPIPVRPTDVPPVRQQVDQTPLGVFNQKITGPDYGGFLTPEEQARTVKIKYPTTKEEPKQEEAPKEEKSTLESIGNWINNTAAALDRGFAKNIIGNPIKGLGTLIQGLNAKVTGTSGKEPITDALIKFGDYYNKMIDELAPQDEEYKNSLSDQFAQAFGQVASLIATGGAAKAAGAAGKSTSALQMAELASQTAPKAAGVVSGTLKTVGAELSAPTSISAGLSMGQAEFDRAIQAGATDDQAYEAFLKNASVGSILETIPVMGFLKRFDKATAGGVKNYLKTKTISGLVGGTEEMTTEILQQLYSNKTAKDIYNTNQDLFEGVGESGGVGFGVGFLLNAMGANAKILRKQGKEVEAAIIEKQMQEFQEKPKGPPPSYKLNGIVLNPDIAPDLLDKMSGAELIKSKLEIKNDRPLELKIQDKIVSHSVKEQVRQGNPDLNEPSLNAITDLEVQLKKLEGNTTQTGKDKAAAVRSQIKDIQENQLQEEATLETVKSEENAIQKQTTNEGVLLSQQPEVGLQEVGKGNIQPEGTTAGTKETIAPKIKEEVKTKEQIDAEAEKLHALLGTPSGEPKFRLAEETEKPLTTDTEVIEKEMNNMPAVELNFTEPEVSQKGLKVNPVAESNSTVKIDKETGDALLKPIQSFNGIPMITGMSDMLSAGKIKDSEGNEMDVEGGLLFNVLGKNKEAAWAGVNKESAQAQYDNAIKLYQSNKELFDRLWSEGKLPDGHIPMAIMRMADTAVNSNEAVFRWILPTVEKFSKKNNVNAMKAFIESVKEKLNTKSEADASSAQRILDFIKEKKVISLNQFLKEIISDSNNRAKGNVESKLKLDNRSMIYDLIFAPKGIKTASKPTVKALLNGTDNSRNKLFTSDVIYNSIGEPSMLKTKQGEVVSIVGIDVKNGGVIPVEHGNYGFGPKGKTIALIENPTHGIDVFPEWKAKTSRVFKENKAGKVPSPESVAIQTGGAFFTDKAFKGAKVSVGLIDDLNLLIGKLRFAFPSVSVSTTQEEFNNIINSPDVRTETSNGKIILGVTKDGKIYLNPEMASLQTPIHEFGHIWIDFLRSDESGKKGTDLLDRGLGLIKNTEEHKKAIEKYGDNELALEEALVELMANKGATIIDAAKKSQFKSWLNAVFKYIQEKFITFKDLDVNKISKIKLEDFINTGLADLFSGKEVSAKFAPELSVAAFKARMSAITDINEIIKIGRANGISEEAITKVLKDKNFNEQEIISALEKPTEAAKKVELSEEVLPGYDRMMQEVDGIIQRSQERGASNERTKESVMNYVTKSSVYEKATDVQREKLVRDVNKMFGVKEKAVPSAGKIIGDIKDVTKITMTEKQGLIKQIKDLARGAKDAKTAITIATQQLSKEVKELVGQGKLTVNQAANVLRKFSKVNVLSQKSINSFTDYMTKVFAKADYVSKLNQANSLKKDISKLSKNKDKNANLRDMAQKFVKIDPSMVEDIESYNNMASKIKEAIKGSTIRKEKVTFADTVNIENATDYITETLTAQDEKIREQKAEEIQDLMGIDVSELSYDQMMELLDSKQPITKYNESIIRDTIQKMFDIYSSIINATIKTGKDQFNDEDVEFTKNQKVLIKRFMDMDLSLLKPKEALQTVDALANFLENHSTAKMETVLSEYTANFNAKKLAEKGVVAQPLKKYWSEKFGRFLGEQTTNLNVLFEKMFKGFNRGGEVEDAMGVTKLKNNKSMAQREANNIVDKYVSQFYNKKANGEAYNSEYNSVERGLAAFMIRNVIGTENEMQDEFNRRKGLIEESINVLSQGNEQEQKKGELYKKVYDKVLKDSQSIQAVKDKTDNTNLDGVDFWNKEWADKYEQLSDVSENVYNKVLDKDLNYTPDKFVKLSSETGNVELSNDESAFHNNNGTIYKKETGVLMTAVKPEVLPTNSKNGETSMFIDLSFDKNNANAMYDALVDMGTAAPIRQIEAFLNSSDFKKIVPKAEDAKILKDRIQLYVGNIRNKNPYSNDELSAAVRSLNKIANIGVSQALGGVLQPIKQVIPVAMNTLVNAGSLDMGAIFSAAKNNFINRTGYAISNRGIESQAQVESLNKLIDEASKSKGEALVKKVEQLNKWWLEKFLVKPDLFIARASWITYYEQSLKKQGVNPNGIDYNTHEVNEQAADYAQRMVDRQQNVSDSDLAGKMFSNKESSNQLFVKILMPFASFRMNQSARLGADLAVLSDKTSTQEDKKIAIRSLSGFAVEMATFKMVAAGSAILLGSLAKIAMGDDEDDEEYKKRVNNVIKGQVTSSFTDVMSPLPILDKAYQKGGNFLTETLLDIPKESVFSIYGVPKQEYVQSLGLFGIAADRASQLYDISKLATTGEYTDEYGKVKQISEKNKENLGYLIGPAILSNVGLAPVEINSIVKNAIKDAKKGKGKSTEEKADAIERKEQKQEDIDQKVEALDKIREDVSSSKELDAIDEKINELEATNEEKKVIAEENRAERELKKELLTDPNTGKEYDNESDLKRYQPSIYEKNFGEQSDWYKNHQDEKDVEKRLREELRRQKDEEEGYIPVSKSRKNSDGTFKRSTFGPQKEGKRSTFGPQKRTSKSVFGPR